MRMHSETRAKPDEFEGTASPRLKDYLNPHSRGGGHQSRFVRNALCRGVMCITFASLALRNDLKRNLNRSNSVCITMTLKFVFGSNDAVCSSTTSI
jgi:hypothetical protein